VFDLAEILAHRKWLRRPWPFPHVIARDVFRRDFYGALAGQLREILSRGLSEAPARDRFSRSIPGYDAYGIGLDRALPGPLAIFLSPLWRDLLSGLFGIGVTPYVFAGAHYHATGSKSGFVHNDFNPTWFPRAATMQIQTPNHELCAYRSGVGPLDASRKIEVVRGAAMIFFLLNDGWRPGDEGETGLYDSARRPVSEPGVRVAPENNCLVAFECTPHSFHAYLTNTRLPRTSIIMWVHRPLEEAAEKYGRENLERWVQ
jgi:hypothetical protein